MNDDDLRELIKNWRRQGVVECADRLENWLIAQHARQNQKCVFSEWLEQICQEKEK